MLRLRGVGRNFATGTVALEHIDLLVAAGEFLVLLGPSGCGKSTLLRLIAGLDRPTSGALEWAGAPPGAEWAGAPPGAEWAGAPPGAEWAGAPPGAGQIGFVFQDPVLMPWASAIENVALPLRLRGGGMEPARDVRARAMAALRLVGLDGFAEARPKTLSGGMRMRVSIARALVGRPQLLLMDEPFAALDEFTRHRLQDECLAITRTLGCTTVFVTHSLYEAAYLATRVVVMSPRPGRIAAEMQGADEAARLRSGEAFLARVSALSEALHRLQLAA